MIIIKKTIGILRQYCRFEPALANNVDITDFNESNVTSTFDFKVKLPGQAGNDGTKQVGIMVPLKYLSNFWKTFELPLIN